MESWFYESHLNVVLGFTGQELSRALIPKSRNMFRRCFNPHLEQEGYSDEITNDTAWSCVS
ncbi:hypothetical protein T265_05688 [Opisthorchis viverrini]|uniref:Uncharacterized protein n=1 Tax=Opisthorchis viverrini TaxID=6198 RepID=A0A074ZNA7_OPIVI|nr:hypothetical protein T265_05688 [Opisthorchis viverrini]KER27222.1 hypothetical protein T265_05688 [Opisthorchis viverrini]